MVSRDSWCVVRGAWCVIRDEQWALLQSAVRCVLLSYSLLTTPHHYSHHSLVTTHKSLVTSHHSLVTL